MILTCPNCGTQYVVKDGAIPPEGRHVRCAACKHSWHQDPEPLELTESDVSVDSEPGVAAGAFQGRRRAIALAGMKITKAANEQLGFRHPANGWNHISFCQFTDPVEMPYKHLRKEIGRAHV